MRKNKTDSFVNRFYNKLISPKTIKICGFSILGLYLGLLFIGVIIAAIFGPEGYTILTHYISDLGSLEYTPAPYLYDIACIFAGILTIPFTYYLENQIASIPRNEDLPAPHRWIYRLMSWGYLFSMIGSIFYIGVGIFSADRDISGMHGICSMGAFGGFTFSAIFFGLSIIFSYQKIVPKPINYILGFIGIHFPIYIAILNLIYGGPFLEWLLLFVILAWILPLNLFTIKYAEKQLLNIQLN